MRIGQPGHGKTLMPNGARAERHRRGTPAWTRLNRSPVASISTSRRTPCQAARPAPRASAAAAGPQQRPLRPSPAGQFLEHGGEGRDADARSPRGRRARRARARRRSGCARTAWPSVSGRPARRRRGRRRWAAPARRCRPRRARRPPGRAAPVSKPTCGAADSAVTVSVTPCSARRLFRRPRGSRRPSGPSPPRSGARASSQARTALGTALTPPGSAMILPKVASVPSRSAHSRAASTVAAKGSIGSRRSASRAVPGVVGPAGEVEAPAAVRPDALGDADRPRPAGRPGRGPARCAVRRRRRCRPAVPRRGRARPGRTRPRPSRRPRLTPVAVAQRPGRLGSDDPGQQPAAQAGDAEPGALLLAERGHRDRPDRDAAAGAQQVDGGEPGHHAERAVERAAVGHRVQVAAGHDRAGARWRWPAGAAGRAGGGIPPGPQVAVAVGRDRQVALGGRGRGTRPRQARSASVQV